MNADTEGIKTYADRLGVGQLYGLFACMVAGRSWNSITKGIDRTEKNQAEVMHTAQNISLIFPLFLMCRVGIEPKIHQRELKSEAIAISIILICSISNTVSPDEM